MAQTKRKRSTGTEGKHKTFDGRTRHTAAVRADARRRRGHHGGWLRRQPTQTGDAR